MWSTGCLLVELITGHILFHDADVTVLLSKIIQLRGAPPDGWMASMPLAGRLKNAMKRVSTFSSQRGKFFLIRFPECVPR